MKHLPFLSPWPKAAGAVLLAGILAGCTGSNASPEGASPKADRAEVTAALTVETSVAEASTVESSISATGTVAAWQEVIVSAEISGLAIVDVNTHEGDTVSKGQVLARLNADLLKTQVRQQDAAIREAQAAVVIAESADKRAQALLAKKTVSQETAENAKSDLDTARATLARSEAALEELHVQLSRTQVLSPVDGYILKPPAVVGTVVQNGAELFHIVRDSRLELAAKVPEQYLDDIEPGQTVEVVSSAGTVVAGTVRGVAAEVDSSTRLGTVYVSLPDTSDFRPGMFGRAVISTKTETVLSVPESSVVWRDGNPQVFVVSADGEVALRPVETGARSGGKVAITSGIAPGERVATSGAGFLNDGNTVRVVEANVGSGEIVR